MKQLALNLQFNETVTFDSFYVAKKNRELVDSLKHFVVAPSAKQARKKLASEPLFYLSGEPGVGKTHIAHALCHYAGALGARAGYLDFSSLITRGPQVLEGLDRLDLLCWDQLEALFETAALQAVWREPLFHLFNRLREQGTQLLVVARSGPKHMNIGLSDLESRLAWGLNYHLKPLSDAEQCDALIFLARQRGILLPNLVAEYVLKRIGRKMSELNGVVDRLDAASLSEQRKITIPFVKQAIPDI